MRDQSRNGDGGTIVRVPSAAMAFNDNQRTAQPDEEHPSLVLRLFGPFEARLSGTPLPRLRSRKGELLLALLVLRHGSGYPRSGWIERSWLAGLLWPDSSEQQALANLRISLADLRRALGPEAQRLRSPSPRTLRLDLTGVEADVVSFDASVARGDAASLEEAIALYRGPLLEGSVGEWVFEQRQARQHAYLQALAQLAARAMERGEPDVAEHYLRLAVAADPAREPAQRELMRALTASGSYAAALQVYRDLRLLLHREFNAEPDPDTHSLFEAIRAEAQSRAATGRSPTDAGPRDLSRHAPSTGTGRSDLTVRSANGQSKGMEATTLTFLLVDIAGSSVLWEEQPDVFRLALERHAPFLRDAIETNRGHLFRTAGDSFCSAFETPADGLDAVLAAHRHLRNLPPSAVAAVARLSLQVRMALHTGVAERHDGEYFGPALYRAARLLEVAHGGQVLLSGATRELVQDDLPPGASLRDLGRHRLRDLQRSEQIYQLFHPELAAVFPPLPSLGTLPNNLPQQVTRFIGREREMAEVKEHLANTRLLTLTGAGGCGKTRLALQVAADLLQEYADGVWLVDLAALAEPALLPRTVAAALGVREQPGQPIEALLGQYLQSRRLLLLLDNCEHLLAACAEWAETWLRGCPELRILATSREGLGIAGETTYRVPSLPVPGVQVFGPGTREAGSPRSGWSGIQAGISTDPDHLNTRTPEYLLQFEAVRLFLDRAIAALPSFALTEQNGAAIAQVCHRLDGIPLAIELAAARVQALPVERIAERLDDRFRLLTAGSRTALPRQQTLRGLIDWSYDLLSSEERVLLHRLSVFAGGWTLEAAEAICAECAGTREAGGRDSEFGLPSDPDLPPTPNSELRTEEVLDLLTRLVSKSLVVYEVPDSYRGQERSDARGGERGAGRGGGEARYRLLEIVRQYSRDRLEEAGEKAAVRERHRDFFLTLVERAAPELWDSAQRECLDRLEAEHDNIRAALGWSVENGDAAAALRLAGALTRFWDVRRHISEGRDWLARVLSLEGASKPDALRGRALFSAGMLAHRQDDYPAAQRFWTESLAIQRRLGDRRGVAEVISASVELPSFREAPAAWALLEESLAICRELEDRRGIARALTGMGSIAAERGEYAPARASYEEALALYREINDRVEEAASLRDLGDLADLQRMMPPLGCSTSRA